MKYLVTFGLFFAFGLGCSQQMFYSSTQKIQGLEYRTVIGTFNILNCQRTEIYVDTTDISNGYIEWGDIAFCPDGNLYALGHDGIYLIDLNSKTHTKITSGPPGGIQPKGMTCTKDSVLIFSNRDKNIYTYDLKSQQLAFKGRVPDSLFIWANIFWIDGKLMGSSNTKVVEIDLNNPSNSQLYCTLPSSGLLSFTQVAISCDSIALFAFYISGEIFLVNPADCSFSYYCSLPEAGIITYQGSDPAFMFMPPEPCKIDIDLDLFDETIAGIDYKDTISCSLPGQFLFSQIDLFSDKPWDSLSVWIEQGPPGFYLDGVSPPFASLSGSQSKRLDYYNINSGNLADLSPYLNDLLLTGTLPPGFTSVKIGFNVHAKNLISDTAYAFITLVGRSTSSGMDGAISYCPDDQSFLLSSLISLNATTGGQWTPATQLDGQFNPAIDQPGVYLYIVQDPYCDPDTAVFSILPHLVPFIGLGPDKHICSGDTMTLSVQNSNVVAVWSTGDSGPTIIITNPMDVWVNVTDEFGCTYSDSIRIAYDDQCIAKKLFIPNVFSPDNNGINDQWVVGPDPGIQSMEVTIFDRWGDALYHQKGSSVSWNGNTFSEEDVASGVYVYQILFTTPEQHLVMKTGNVTLVK